MHTEFIHFTFMGCRKPSKNKVKKLHKKIHFVVHEHNNYFTLHKQQLSLQYEIAFGEIRKTLDKQYK